MRDVCILPDKVNQTYYMVGPGRNSVRVYTSKDLKMWQGPKTIFRTPEDIWGDIRVINIWAPEMHKYKDKYYLFLTRERPHYRGHNPVAGLSYAWVGLLVLVQGITGFALYAEPYSSGFWRAAFGWLLTLFGNQTLRLIHHIVLWFFGIFTIGHIYMAALGDIEERSGAVTSIITGVKFDQLHEEN